MLSNHTSDISEFAALLSAERRWLVSGTPTTHLVGEGLRAEKKSRGCNPEQLVVSQQFGKSVPWNHEDRQDLQKLSKIFSHFLELPQFRTDPAFFAKSVIKPLMTTTPSLFGAVQVVYQLLSQHMIRHR